MSKTNSFYSQSGQTVADTLGARTDVGLMASQVEQRRAKFGLNQLPSGPKLSAFKLLLSQFKDVLIMVLVVAATLSLGVSFIEHDAIPTEALLIYSSVVAIAIVGFFNEYKAEKTVDALRKLVAQTCRVRRGGEVLEVPSEELVPGDIVLLEEGKKIPADIRILQANHLQANEASLTGESLPVNKTIEPLTGNLALADQNNMLFSGTLVTTGTAEGIVVATGAETEIGHIAHLVSSVESEQTPMQRKLDDLGRKLGLVILVICAAMFVAILFLDHDLAGANMTQKILLAFTAAVALAVAAIPEGLAFVVRISLALGARRMAAKNALVRRLAAVESLGSTDVICSDKTGTLTAGEMTVRELFAGNDAYELAGSGYGTTGKLTLNQKTVAASADITQLLTIGLLCNNSRLKDDQVLGDPTEGCLIVSAAKVGLVRARVDNKYTRVNEVPFSSARKMMSTLHESGNGYMVAVKGAPDVLLGHCDKLLQRGKEVALTVEAKRQIMARNDAMAAKALRVLGFAYRTFDEKPGEESMEEKLIFVGLQAMMDPPRVEVKEVIERVQTEAGMRVIMITGDNVETAKAVAREVGIIGEAFTGIELDDLDDDAFAARVESIGVYARVNPEHKMRIIRALKYHGHQVAMTGDGVNDAPAIKAADIGIAMGITGTDAAKEASDMILLDDQFLTIINAIEEGRGIFDNVRKFVNFLLSCNIAEVITILLGVLIHQNLLLTAAQILFINIVTDGLPAIALGNDPTAKDVMKLKPHHYQQSIINRRVWLEIFVFGGLMSLLILWHYSAIVGSQGAAAASSVVFIAMVLYEFVRLADIRSDYGMKWWSNPLITLSLLVSIGIQLAIVYLPPLANLFKVTPISGLDWLVILAGMLGLFGVMKLLNPLFDKFGPEYGDLPAKPGV